METKPKKKLYKKWWFWLIVVIIIGAYANANGNNTPKKVGDSGKAVASNSSNTDDKKTTETKKEEPKGPQVFKVGDIVQLNDIKITVNKVYTVKGDDMVKPKEGNEFLAVDCTIENISDKSKAISSIMMFKVVDKDGRACEYSLMGQTAAKAGQLDGEIGVGRKMSGVYVVEVPKGTTGLQLEFDSSLFTGGQVVVQLN